MFAVKDTGSILLVNDPKIPDRFVLWVQFVEGLLSLIAIICLVLALAFPKFGTILGPRGGHCLRDHRPSLLK